MSRKKILIADDEPNLVRSLSFILNKEGYEVMSAGDGAEALQKMKEFRPDIVFLDVMMPRRNGYEVLNEMRHSPELKDILVIMLTAKGQETDREKSLATGSDEFIAKPFSQAALITRVKEMLQPNTPL